MKKGEEKKGEARRSLGSTSEGIRSRERKGHDDQT